MRDPNSAEAIRDTLERYKEGWNQHDVDAEPDPVE
jgi:hypothetical protein